MADPSGGPVVYALRIADPAQADVQEVMDYLTQTAGQAAADRWQDGFFTQVAALALFPGAHPVAGREGQALGLPGVRAVLYRHTERMVHRVLFLVAEAGEGGDGEGPTVTVVMVRHAARRPLTRQEGQERRTALETEQEARGSDAANG